MNARQDQWALIERIRYRAAMPIGCAPWHLFHAGDGRPRPSDRRFTERGYPDLVLAGVVGWPHAGRLVVIEATAWGDDPRPDQVAWLESYGLALLEDPDAWKRAREATPEQVRAAQFIVAAWSWEHRPLIEAALWIELDRAVEIEPPPAAVAGPGPAEDFEARVRSIMGTQLRGGLHPTRRQAETYARAGLRPEEVGAL